MGKKITGASITLPAPFNATSSDPVDSRFVVETKSDLINKETFGYSGNYCYIYEGIPVYVSDEQATYTYMGPFDKGNGVPIEGGMNTLDNWIKTGDKDLNINSISETIDTINSTITTEINRAKQAESDLSDQIVQATRISDLENNIIWLTESGFSANVGLKWNGTQLQLIDHNNKVISSINGSDFIKDGMLNTVELIGTDLIFTFNTDSGKEAVRVSMSSFVDLYDGSNVLLTDFTVPNTYVEPKSGDSINNAIANLISNNRRTSQIITELNQSITDNNSELDEINNNISNINERLDNLNIKDVDNITITKDTNGIIGFKGKTVNKQSTIYNTIVNDNTPLGMHITNIGFINSDMYIYDATREISEEANNIVQEKALAKHLKEVNTNTTDLDDRLSVTEGKLLIIETGAKIAINVSPSVIYKNTATNITIRGTFSSSDSTLTPTKMVIKYGSQEIATVENNKTVSITESNTLVSNTKTYTIEAYVDPNNTGNPTKLTVNGNLNARNAIYAGFGTTAEEIITVANRLSARTSANGNYTKTATTDDVNYFILVPNDITALKNFTMGGAPYVMNKSTATIDGITYNVFKSGGTYNSGATVNITAS